MKDLLRLYILESLLDSNEELDEEELEEFSGAGAVAGMSLPLGMSPGTPSEPYVPKTRLGKKHK